MDLLPGVPHRCFSLSFHSSVKPVCTTSALSKISLAPFMCWLELRRAESFTSGHAGRSCSVAGSRRGVDRDKKPPSVFPHK